MTQELNKNIEQTPNLDNLNKLIEDYMDITHMINTKNVETENIDISELNLEKESKYEKYNIELKKLKKLYPQFMKNKGRESAYHMRKLMLDNRVSGLVKDDLVESIIQMDIGYEPHINCVNNWSREMWDHLSIKMDEDPDSFKNKVSIHIKLSEKLKTLILQDSELKKILIERDPLNPVLNKL